MANHKKLEESACSPSLHSEARSLKGTDYGAGVHAHAGSAHQLFSAPRIFHEHTPFVDATYTNSPDGSKHMPARSCSASGIVGELAAERLLRLSSSSSRWA